MWSIIPAKGIRSSPPAVSGLSVEGAFLVLHLPGALCNPEPFSFPGVITSMSSSELLSRMGATLRATRLLLASWAAGLVFLKLSFALAPVLISDMSPHPPCPWPALLTGSGQLNNVGASAVAGCEAAFLGDVLH